MPGNRVFTNNALILAAMLVICPTLIPTASPFAKPLRLVKLTRR